MNECLIYEDMVIAVALVSPDGGSDMRLAIRWIEPGASKGKDGRTESLTNLMGGSTGWFIVPFTFGTAIGRTLVHQNAAGLGGFHAAGFAVLVRWLIESEELNDAMCY